MLLLVRIHCLFNDRNDLNKFSSKIGVYVTKKSHQNILIYVPRTTEFVATRLENFQTCLAPYKAVVNYI